jgi:hypothetical protein
LAGDLRDQRKVLIVRLSHNRNPLTRKAIATGVVA